VSHLGIIRTGNIRTRRTNISPTFFNGKRKTENGKRYHWTSPGPEATRALTAALGKWLAPGDVLALTGELGSGKTEFVRGLAQGLGVDPNMVASPSFTLVHEYQGRLPLAHLDLYRLENLPGEMLPDLEAYLSPPWVAAVEWAERLGALLTGDYLEIKIEISGENTREFTFRGHGARGAELVRLLARQLVS